MKKHFYIERSNKDGTYQLVYTHDNYDKCIDRLETINSDLRHELWCDEWSSTVFGHTAMAWIN